MANSPLILIVDDVPDMRSVLEALIDEAGFHAIAAGSIQEMMTLFESKTKTIDLVLLDMNLPDGSGIQAIEKLKALLGEAVPKICMVSGERDKSVVMKAIKGGVVDYIVKPVDTVQLKAKLQKIIYGKAMEQFPTIGAALKIEFSNLPVETNSFIYELSEVGFKMKTNLKLKEKGHLEFAIPSLARFTNYDKSFSCVVERVISCGKEFEIHGSFSGLHENIIQKIRSLVIKGEEITDEKLKLSA